MAGSKAGGDIFEKKIWKSNFGLKGWFSFLIACNENIISNLC